MSSPPDSGSALAALVERALSRLAERAPDALSSPERREGLAALALCSDFAIDTLCRQPELIDRLDAPFAPPPLLDAGQEADWPAGLRRWRAAESTRLVWRDLRGMDDVDATLAGSSRIADAALQSGVAALSAQLTERHGVVRNAAGQAQSLVVFGLGKLGGGELNFSSDVDLVYAFPEHGQSDGARPLDAEAWFTRLGQRLAQLLGDVTADGFCHRVDLRLRPFGASGRLVLSFGAMEQYFQREGRDWERYAWIKARPVAGDLAAGESLLKTLRPFVYRRYLDYGALDGLREMKALIAAQVQRRELAEDLKLGPGGIREVEFLVQALQLIRAGREPALRGRALLPALAALAAAGHVAPATADRLAAAYRALRRLENRVQMLGDQQVHALPDDPLARLRIARALGHADTAAMLADIDSHRSVVAEEFAGLLEARRRRRAPANALVDYWRALPDGGDAQVLADAGFGDAQGQDAALRDFARTPAVRALSGRGRQRLDNVLPALLAAAARSDAADASLPRGLALLQAITRRTSYLALLEEQPAAMARLADVTARSALLSERLAAHPLLLDELLDSRAAGPVPDEAQVAALVAAVPRTGDTEAALNALNEVRQAIGFRVGLATLGQRLPPGDATQRLAALAENLLLATLDVAECDIIAAHGRVPGAGLAVLGYGSLGGRELGFGSDLDLVFLHDAPADASSDGARPLDAPRYFARLAQRLVSLLGTVTGAGKLYEVDVRLRPDGAKGMLVSSLDSFSDYQRQRAWTWERQALVRARPIAGAPRVQAAFEAIRTQTLCQPRDHAALRTDVVAMRRRMRTELDRSSAARFDLKQGEGGLVDLEFLVQALVLEHAASHPSLVQPRGTPELLAALGEAGVLASDELAALLDAHALMLGLGLDCTLDQRPRLVPPDDALDAARAVVHRACRRFDLEFT
ncbi:MAG: bifunctional [glutamate--ammonia ligase]-adenylyl-L-tyrosine phosphorylase/[glutamate--ammonia-ligase] adenylyltransferase [Arenimonas sp.]|uniref:bifunctional [glutamate--ammonia ligase]-adenylyl-L-tyrosine phosphorylase/[glutamate--ammonia-ligase] adenylyltransferase n=1 Tax=Arenimonas sp. TaxID=1872635 RepID=UPI0025BC5082|nr:bifunctional [glutamate--ammonia ligase]-adenylyl-L-tyrosine phosphorylase/[glutamate--ammonia-ligase] adenylyltransferase [Arenimonas sp.]MBW8368506.1 bifunctional [glutamate--ammonia ligase]-adenylyl-L-tyrosine phosphorylase/[glutamate--ammonia-ligase] adenylyltransferase [Arenimonas sp.]